MDSPSPARTTTPSTAPASGREDCWNEDATRTLVEAWGERYLELNRGKLRQNQWREVADAVNDRHGDLWKQPRTDIQCKNRIDTLKKKYKIEKGRVSRSTGVYAGQWPFFARLEALIGDKLPPAKKSSQMSSRPKRKTPPSPTWPLSSPVPVGPRSGTQKRSAPATSMGMIPADDSSFRRNFSAFAAAAAEAAEGGDEKEDSERSGSRSRSSEGSRKRDRAGDREGYTEMGFRELAKAIEKFGEIYERVEAAKQRKMIELEKQKMQFVKDLECQRMQLFMETHVELQKMKAKKSANNYS